LVFPESGKRVGGVSGLEVSEATRMFVCLPNPSVERKPGVWDRQIEVFGNDLSVFPGWVV